MEAILDSAIVVNIRKQFYIEFPLSQVTVEVHLVLIAVSELLKDLRYCDQVRLTTYLDIQDR